MLEISIALVLSSLALVLIRGVRGPEPFDRILVSNSFGTHVVVLIVLLGHAVGTEYFIDIALVYGLINFIATIGFLRYFQNRRA